MERRVAKTGVARSERVRSVMVLRDLGRGIGVDVALPSRAKSVVERLRSE